MPPLHRIVLTALVGLLALGLLALGPARAAAQSPADPEAIRQAALDYIEGYYEGDAARMERALHPELAKRIIRTDSLGRSWVSTMGASQLVAGTRAGHGREIPAADQKTDVTILDQFHDIASARIDAGAWIDYLHLARVDGRWVIVNVLWATPPEAGR
jgi:hypothetical protein